MDDDLNQKQIFDNKIDFDEASKAWRQNKTYKRGCVTYCCGVIKTNGEPCKAPPHSWKRNLKIPRHFEREWGLCTKHYRELQEK